MTSSGAEFTQTLHALFGPRTDSIDDIGVYNGVELLRADPRATLDLCPDASGPLSVYLPLPGIEAGGPRIVIKEDTELTDNRTTIFVDDGALHAQRIIEKYSSRRPYSYSVRGMPMIELPLEEPEVTTHELDASEAEVLLSWLGTVKPHKRHRPISLFNIGRLAAPVDPLETGPSDAKKLKAAIDEQFSAEDIPESDRQDLGRFETIKRLPTERVTELTDGRAITIWRCTMEEASFEEIAQGLGVPTSKEFRDIDLPQITISNSGYTDAHTLAVYPEGNSVYARYGPKPQAAERFTVAVKGVTIMDCVTDPVKGEAAVRLNSQQVAGLVEMVNSAGPVVETRIGRWDQL